MRRYCFGASKFGEEFILYNAITIDGFFDNDSKKWGTTLGDYKIEKPYYDADVEIYITTRQQFTFEIINQLLEIGYRMINLVRKIADREYKILRLDYTQKEYEKEKNKLVLLHLEHNSYSGICAINKLCNNRVNTYGLIVKFFSDNMDDLDYYYDLAIAKYIITERSWKDIHVPAKIIQLWHGFPLKSMYKMCPNYTSAEELFLYQDWIRYKYILSYGQNYTTVVSACCGTRGDQFVVTGMPRNDLLFCTDGRRNIEKRFLESAGKKIVLYMPTFREIAGNKNGDEKGYIFYWDDFKLERFKEYCRSNNIYFIFKLHPCDESKVKNWCEQSDCIGLLNDELLGEQCTYEFLNGVDILITDYSSVYFDYMLLDRPIIFTNKDEKEYLENRGMLFEPLDFWRPGAIVNTMDDLQKEIVNVLNGDDSHSVHRKQLIPFVHKYTDGNSTQRLFDLLKKDMES